MVTLDENLTFNDHVYKVTTKISKSVGIMKLQCQLPVDISCKIYFSINGLCTGNLPLSQQTPTPYKIKVNR